LAKISRKRRN